MKRKNRIKHSKRQCKVCFCGGKKGTKEQFPDASMVTVIVILKATKT